MSSNGKNDAAETRKKMKELIDSDPDFINAPHFSNSLNIFMKESKKELKDASLARMMMMSTEEFRKTYLSALSKIKRALQDPERKV